MPSDESETSPGSDDRTEPEESGSDAAAEQPRDPETGKFLPKSERQSTEVPSEAESPSASGESSPAPEGEPGADSSVGGSRTGRQRPETTTPTFVTNPDGYPRPPTVYLPALPWLRTPVRPPAHETVMRPR